MDTRHLTGPSEEGSVVVDIGGDVGAAIVSTPASLVGSEIEIRPCGAAWDGTHVAVRERQVAGGVMHAALFPGLAFGTYEVRLRGDAAAPVTTFTVEGGRVSATRLTPQGSATAAAAAAAPTNRERAKRERTNRNHQAFMPATECDYMCREL